MHGARDEFFTATALARDENSRVGLRYALDQVDQLLHRRTREDGLHS